MKATSENSITLKERDSAMWWVVKNVDEIGKARGRAKVAPERLKVIKAEQSMLSKSTTVADRERDAMSSKEYKQGIEDWENAVADAETLSLRKEAYLALCSAYQTQEATNRNIDRMNR